MNLISDFRRFDHALNAVDGLGDDPLDLSLLESSLTLHLTPPLHSPGDNFRIINADSKSADHDALRAPSPINSMRSRTVSVPLQEQPCCPSIRPKTHSIQQYHPPFRTIPLLGLLMSRLPQELRNHCSVMVPKCREDEKVVHNNLNIRAAIRSGKRKGPCLSLAISTLRR